MPILFSLDHVSVSIDSTHILKGISFEIQTGEFLGIVGPNGSGKSTLLKTLAGVIKPTAGAVSLDDRDIRRIPGRELAKRLAVVPQDSPVAFDYSVMEIVLMGRSPHLGRFQIESSRDMDIAADALRRAGVLHLADRKVPVLSGGERQRVMIARALAQESDILFLDEPTSHLDLKYQVETLELVRREVREHGKTAVVVLHDLNLAAEFCDRLMMIRAGELYAAGIPDEVITADIVRNVYGASVWVRRHPTSGRPYVLSLGSHGLASRLVPAVRPGALRVHVVCGGGCGGPIFVQLIEAGCDVTAGVINIGDTDQETAESLGIEYVEDAPFSPISAVAENANMEFIRSSDAVVVGDVPFGDGNLANLRDAVSALDFGKRVAVIGDPKAYADRDFTGGEATRLLTELISRGASVLESSEGLAGWVAKIRGA